ncbi:MAG: cupin domain-containing protein [Brevinematia bacterium]
MQEKINLNTDIVVQSGGTVSLNILKKEHGNIDVFSFDRGQKISEHTSPYEATVIVIEGELKIVIGGETYTLSEKEAIVMPANVPHSLEALKLSKMILVMIR